MHFKPLRLGTLRGSGANWTSYVTKTHILQCCCLPVTGSIIVFSGRIVGGARVNVG